MGVIEFTAMPANQFTAFYPSRPFWAGSKVNFSDKSREGWFHDQMVEEVFFQETGDYTIKVCRDGRIMLRVAALELERGSGEHEKIEETVKRWGEYLDFLNAFYLLLDSSAIEVDKRNYFNLHEITTRDAFRVNYEGGRCLGENIAPESVASVFQMGRYGSGWAIEHDPKTMMRQVISIDAIEHASIKFTKVLASPGLEKTLAAFAKSLSEYKVGNYETSVILSWFITEAVISDLWKTHIDSLNADLSEGRKRINRERRDFLTGRDFPISLISSLLELWGVLPHAQFLDIDAVRGFRNKIVHGYDSFAPGPKEAQLAMNTGQAMIDRRWGLRFTTNTSYSVVGL